jgi:hypothetical protein
MSTSPITMEELESERAELLPSRETLCSRWGAKTNYGHSSSSVTQVGQGNVNGSGNYDQFGLINVQADNNNVNVLGLQSILG